MKKLLAIVLATVMALSMVTVTYAAKVEDNLVAHWSFDEADVVLENGIVKTVKDVSGNGYDLTVDDTANELVEGFTGNAVRFTDKASTGSDGKHMTLTDDTKFADFVSKINGKPGTTVSMMIKRMVYGSGHNPKVFDIFCTKGSVFSFTTSTTTIATLNRHMINGSTASSAAQKNFIPITGVDFGPLVANNSNPVRIYEWCNITVVADYTGKTVKVYVDGALADTLDATSKFTADVSSYVATANDYLGLGAYHNMIDEVKVFNKALTANEVAENISPVLHYGFSELTSANTIANQTARDAQIALDGGIVPSTDVSVTKGAVGNTLDIAGAAGVANKRGGSISAKLLEQMLSKSKAVSFSMWVRLGETTGITNTLCLFTERSMNPALRVDMYKDGRVGFVTKLSGDSGYSSAVSSTGLIKAGDLKWHHIAGTADYTNKKITVYVDGVKVAENTAPNYTAAYYNIPFSSAVADDIQLNTYGHCLMDELKWYRRALTPNEVALEYKKVYGLNVDADFTVNADSVAASCNVANTTGKTVDASLILGMYNKHTNELLKLDIVDVNGLATDTVKQETITLSNINTPSDYKYKLFVWDGVDTLKPYQLVEQYNK